MEPTVPALSARPAAPAGGSRTLLRRAAGKAARFAGLAPPRPGPTPPVLALDGHCPICAAPARFEARHAWLRDHLKCLGCEGGSIPRERALQLALDLHAPDWRRARLHESSPGTRGLSLRLRRDAPGYVATQFFPGRRPGEIVDGFRNENLEAQTFADGAFDIVVSQDVLEHVNRPDLACREVARTLAPGGLHLFTTPVDRNRMRSERRAIYWPDRVEHLAEPEWHGNPVDAGGALVTFRWGHDLAALAAEWSGMDVLVERRVSARHGVLGEYLDVFVCRKPL